MSESGICLEGRGLCKVYGEGTAAARVFENISVSVRRAEFMVLFGPSGSGKSTLLNIIGLLDKPSAGAVIMDGEDALLLDETDKAALRARKIGFVFQFDSLLPEFTLLENVEMPAVLGGAARPAKSLELLGKFGLAGLAARFPAQLSGGERQRGAIARALRNGPAIILADEPTGNLDAENARAVFEDLRRLAREGAAVVMATHNPDAAKYGDTVLTLSGGRLA
ncbi:MAG: ABC transporter ATP-binding protein [Elusimicrobiales bacterium]